jgi:peptide/nickel transport system permease protein
MRPGSWSARALQGVTVFLLACPPYFLAFMVLVWFSWNSGTLIQLGFVSGQGDYVPLTEDPLRYVKAMWMPWVLCALPLAAYVLRITDASLRDGRHEDYLRTARGVTGVNVSTLLLNVAVIEYGFGIPGLFRVLRAAVEVGDVPVMMALVIEGVILITLANFLADAVQSMLDPRVRLSE